MRVDVTQRGKKCFFWGGCNRVPACGAEFRYYPDEGRSGYVRTAGYVPTRPDGVTSQTTANSAVTAVSASNVTHTGQSALLNCWHG